MESSDSGGLVDTRQVPWVQYSAADSALGVFDGLMWSVSTHRLKIPDLFVCI